MYARQPSLKIVQFLTHKYLKIFTEKTKSQEVLYFYNSNQMKFLISLYSLSVYKILLLVTLQYPLKS